MGVVNVSIRAMIAKYLCWFVEKDSIDYEYKTKGQVRRKIKSWLVWDVSGAKRGGLFSGVVYGILLFYPREYIFGVRY